MRRADSDVQIDDQAPPQSALNDTGTGFMVGMADRGLTTGQQTEDDALTSLGQWVARHGGRQSYNGPEYDAVEAFFTDGGARLYFARYVGSDAEKASITVPAVSPQFTATAKSEGDWANDVDIAVADGVVTIREDSVVVETVTVANVGELQAWAEASSDYIDVTPSVDLDTELTDSAARTLAGGDDDRAGAVDADRTAALARFGRDLGPGSVMIPGVTTIAAHTAIATHCRNMKSTRHGWGDPPDSSDAGTVAAAGLAVRALGTELARHITILDNWIIGPGTVDGTTRVCPPSGMQAGLAARNDVTNPPSRAIAGRNAISRFAQGVKHARTEDDLDELADAGVTAVRSVRGLVQTFDDITPVDPGLDPEWVATSTARLTMAIVVDAYEIADAHMFDSVSGPPDLDHFNGDLKGMMAGWLLRRALYSPDGSAAGAYRVETGPSVNTQQTLANRQLRAAIAFKPALTAREVVITLTNTPLQSAL